MDRAPEWVLGNMETSSPDGSAAGCFPFFEMGNVGRADAPRNGLAAGPSDGRQEEAPECVLILEPRGDPVERGNIAEQLMSAQPVLQMRAKLIEKP